MISKSKASEILNWLFGTSNSSLSSSGALYVGLCKNAIPADGTLSSAGEPSQDSYTRTQIKSSLSSATNNFFDSISDSYEIVNTKEIKFDTAQEDWGLMNYWFLTDSGTKNQGNAILWGTVKDILQDGIELTNSNATIANGTATATLTGKNVITFENNVAYILSIEEKDTSDGNLVAREDEKCVATIITDENKGNIVKFTNAKKDVEIQYYTKNKENSTALEGVFEIKYPLAPGGSIKQQFNINIYGQGINVERNTVPTFFAGELKASIDAVTI